MAILGTMSMTQLDVHVADVVEIATSPQMVWIHATPIIAGMEYECAIRYRPIGQFPCDAMSISRATVRVDLPITVRHNAADPVMAPTLVRLDLLGKPLGQWPGC